MVTGQKFTTLQKTNNIATQTNKRLSVQVSLTGLSFLVSSLDAKEVSFFSEKKFDSAHTPEEVLLQLEEEITTQTVLQEDFEEVSVIYATDVYSLAPSSLFDETKASDYLKFNSKILANDFITHDTIENYEMVVVYVPFVNINNYLFDRYGSFQYYHATTILLKSLLDAEKHSSGAKVFVHVLESTFDLIVLHDGRLQLCNTYTYKTPEDFLYYILFCMEQLKLNPDTIETCVCGAITEKDANFEILYSYIRNISFVRTAGNLNAAAMNDAAHQHFLLKNHL